MFLFLFLFFFRSKNRVDRERKTEQICQEWESTRWTVWTCRTGNRWPYPGQWRAIEPQCSTLQAPGSRLQLDRIGTRDTVSGLGTRDQRAPDSRTQFINLLYPRERDSGFATFLSSPSSNTHSRDQFYFFPFISEARKYFQGPEIFPKS